MNRCQRTYVPQQPIDLQLAVQQHGAYCQSLAECGVKVTTLDVNLDMPDCAFVEDTAIVLNEVAILASMGTPSRRAEPAGIEPTLNEIREVESIIPPATIEGGDVQQIGKTLLVGHSNRTNEQAIQQLERIIARYEYRIVRVPVRDCLHLKTACTALDADRLLVNPNWIDVRPLNNFELIRVPEVEPWGANTLVSGSNVIITGNQPRTSEMIDTIGLQVREVDLSEFSKAEGGVTCLSILIDNS